MRVFIAIEFEKEMKNYLEEIQSKIKPKSVSGSFTDKENFHLTVRFLGEVRQEELQELMIAMEEAAFKFKRFSLKLSNLGFFPKGNKSVVWAGTKESDELKRLFDRLERSLSKQGFPRERKGLSPHITLGREVILKARFDDVKNSVPLVDKAIEVTKISLMESKRRGAKLVYEPIFSAELK